MLSDAALETIANNLAKLCLSPALLLKVTVAVVAPLMRDGETVPKPKGNGKAKLSGRPSDAPRGQDGRFAAARPNGAAAANRYVESRSADPIKSTDKPGGSRSHKWTLNDPTRNLPDRTGEAAAFLRDALSQGPRPASDIEILAEQRGVSPNALGRAKNELGITARRLDRGQGHVVHLLLPGHRIEEDEAEAAAQ